MNSTAIAWTDFTFNLWSGCKKLSAACKFCYADTLAERHRGDAAFPHGFDLTVRPHKLREPHALLRSKGPSLIFVESMSDVGLDDDELTPAEIDRLGAAGFRGMDHLRDLLFGAIDATPEHRYQLLTKRPRTVQRYLAERGRKLPASVWLGVTVENAREAATRLPVLKEIRERFFGPRNVAFVSAEPLLDNLARSPDMIDAATWIDWLIIGGESGTHFNDPKHAGRFLVAKTDPGTPERKSEGLYAVKRGALEAVRGLLELKRGPDVLRAADDAIAAADWQGLAGACSDGTSVRTVARSLASHVENIRSLVDRTRTFAALDFVRACSVPTFFKQWGGPTPTSAGREVDGRTYDEMPTVPGALPERRGEVGAVTRGLARKLPLVST